ncbi:hypothetical protein B0H63DRAFT_472640 [Podospora didyma]|uniref:Uncharacterized protein n=1 Tax=Podospora didyma TaxID=330526 RepID=A0AAE0NPE7_9PEZI|nr:hypothetical protein B0H63DRAFT_472640 [Podospora didyma]
MPSKTPSPPPPAKKTSPTRTKPGALGGPPPPPPPPPAPAPAPAPKPVTKITPPVVAATGPAGFLRVDLLVYNGHPFKDHMALAVRHPTKKNIVNIIHASGSVKTGFTFEVKRYWDITMSGSPPTEQIPLMWVDPKYFDDKMWNGNAKKRDSAARLCEFEKSCYKEPAPPKSLNAVDDTVEPVGNPPKKVTQKNCQTWLVGAADKLLEDGIFIAAVVAYLKKKKQ